MLLLHLPDDVLLRIRSETQTVLSTRKQDWTRTRAPAAAATATVRRVGAWHRHKN